MISCRDVPDVYLVPSLLQEEGLDELVCEELGLDTPPADLGEWLQLTDRIGERLDEIEIALVGKYVKLHDAYLSVHEALKHAGVHHGCRVRVRWVDAEHMSYEEAVETLEGVDGVLVPGGFGSRGWEGKILACRVAREHGIPYLGICLGMHVAVSEFARHVAGLEGANSTEMDPETPYPVIDLLPEQKEIEDLGGTMRLGAQAVELADGTRAQEAYGEAVVHERHRHRYEVNNHLRRRLEEPGLVVSGTYQEGRLVEIIELPDHPWFVASQFHPEFKSRPTRPAPLFRDFVGAGLERAQHAHAGRGEHRAHVAPHLRAARRPRRQLGREGRRARQHVVLPRHGAAAEGRERVVGRPDTRANARRRRRRPDAQTRSRCWWNQMVTCGRTREDQRAAIAPRVPERPRPRRVRARARPPSDAEVAVQVDAVLVAARARGDAVRVQIRTIHTSRSRGLARSSARATAIPAASLPWMHPTTSTGVPCGLPTCTARIGRPSHDRPSRTVRACAGAASTSASSAAARGGVRRHCAPYDAAVPENGLHRGRSSSSSSSPPCRARPGQERAVADG